MRSLADRILAAIPNTPHGLSLRQATEICGSDLAHTRAAFEALDNERRAQLVKRGRGGAIYLVHRDATIPICVVCQTEFERAPKSKRLTCSGHCRSVLNWRNMKPEYRAARTAAIKAAKNTPENKERQRLRNKERWAKPGEREKLSAQNRKRWKDPEASAIIAAKIRLNHQKPEMRKFYSDLRKKDWARPEYAEMVKAKSAASLREQHRRARMGEMLKARWRDPEQRKKLTAANVKRNEARKQEKKRQQESAPAGAIRTSHNAGGGIA